MNYEKSNILTLSFIAFLKVMIIIGWFFIPENSNNTDAHATEKISQASEIKNNTIQEQNNQTQETSNNQNNIYTDISEQIENDVQTLSASEIAIINASDVKTPLNKFNTDNEIIFITPDGREFKVE